MSQRARSPLATGRRLLIEGQKAFTTAHRLVLQSPLGPLLGPFLVMSTTGRRSGVTRQTVLSYLRDGDAFVVIASNGGSPRHPEWYRNLQAHPDAAITVAGRSMDVRAETVEGPDRHALWRRAVRSYPGYAAYQTRAARQIPVVRLRPGPD